MAALGASVKGGTIGEQKGIVIRIGLALLQLHRVAAAYNIPLGAGPKVAVVITVLGQVQANESNKAISQRKHALRPRGLRINPWRRAGIVGSVSR